MIRKVLEATGIEHCNGLPIPTKVEAYLVTDANGSWSSPRKEKNSKPPTGKTEFVANETSKVNPQQGKTRRNPQEGISVDRE